MNVNDEYGFLFDGTDPDWVLVRRQPGETLGSGPPADIFNQRTRMMLLIEDDEVAKSLVNRMLAANVRVLDALPPDESVPYSAESHRGR